MRPAAVVNSGDTLYAAYVEGHGREARGVCTDGFVHTGDWTNGAY